jgi:hypothetical protein
MKLTNLQRPSGLAWMSGGLLQIIASIFHPDNNDPAAILSPVWAPVQVILLVFYVLSMIGLLGLQRFQGKKAGKLGLAGFFLEMVGSAFTIVTSIGFAFVMPKFASPSNPVQLFELLGPEGPLALLGVVSLTYVLFFVPGYFLTGIATLRTGLMPRWAGLLVSAGILFSFIGAAPGSIFILRIVGGIIFGFGLGWLGYTLWSAGKIPG